MAGHGLSIAMAALSTVLPVWLVSGDPSHRCRAGGAGRHFRPGDYDVSGWMLLEESIGAAQLLGAALVIVGVLVMSRRG